MGKKTGLKRVVLDTNVLVSALLFTGPSNRLVKLWQSGSIEIVASAEIMREYTRVLAYPKFGLDEREITALLHEDILPFVTVVRVGKVLSVVKEDPPDDHFLACAVAGKVDAIISGDHHLARLGKHEGIPILNVRSFLGSIG